MPEPAAILTIEAASPGGVPALVDTAYNFMQDWGYAPTVFRTQFAEGNLNPLQRIAATVRTWTPIHTQERGMDAVLVPAPPFPLWLFYAVPHFLFGSLLGQYPMAFVISGSAHVALPLALRGIPYVLWVATVYEDELRAKANTGDRWAQGVLSSPTWRILAAQERLALRKATGILALSHHTARRIVEFSPDAASRVETVLYPVDTARFQPRQEMRGGSQYGRYLLTSARLNDPRKNIPLLLDAFALVRAQRPDLHLVLTGDIPNAQLVDQVAELGITDSVFFPGIVSSDDLLGLYQGAKLFVLPSSQEGLGIVMLEAMACGTPVITTARGGPEGIVIDGVTGCHLPGVDDSGQLADAILAMLEDEAELENMRSQCAAFARDHYATTKIAARIRAGIEAARSGPVAGGRM